MSFWNRPRGQALKEYYYSGFTPLSVIKSTGEWYDFSDLSLGTFVSVLGKKGNFTAIAGAAAPEVVDLNGVRVTQYDNSLTEYIDLGSDMNTVYDDAANNHSNRLSFLITVQPTDGTPAALNMMFGHRAGASDDHNCLIQTTGEVRYTFESSNSIMRLTSDDAQFDETPSAMTIIILELGDPMNMYINGVDVAATLTGTWGGRNINDISVTQNMYLSARHNVASADFPYDGYIGDFIITPGWWTAAEKTALINFFGG